MEEADLAYPGSTQLGELAQDQQTGSMWGPQAAEFGRIRGTDASEDDVEAFFEAELERRGWSAAELAFDIPTSWESRTRVWEKGDALFRLSFTRRDQQGRLDPETLARYPTVYHIRLRLLIPDPTVSPAATRP